AISALGRESGQISFLTTFAVSNLRLAQISVARAQRLQALDYAQRALRNGTDRANSPASFVTPRGLGAIGLTYAALSQSRVRQPGDREQAISWLHKSLEAWRQAQKTPGFSAPNQREMREVEAALAKLEHR